MTFCTFITHLQQFTTSMNIHASFVLFPYTETPLIVAKAHGEFWLKVSVPSPSPTWLQRMRMINESRLTGWHQKIQKRFHVEHHHESGKQFEKKHNKYYLTRNATKSNIITFTDHRPCYALKTRIVTQFVCDQHNQISTLVLIWMSVAERNLFI